MQRIALGLCTAAALCAGALLRLRGRGEARQAPRGGCRGRALPRTRREKVQEAASLATGAAESAAESAQAGGQSPPSPPRSCRARPPACSRRSASSTTATWSRCSTSKLGTRVTFVPATIVVTAGSGRKLSIFNDTDMPHGFRIPGLALEVAAAAGPGDAGRAAAAGRAADLRHRVSPARAAPARVAGGAPGAAVRRLTGTRAAARPAPGRRRRGRPCRARGGSITQRPPASGTSRRVAAMSQGLRQRSTIAPTPPASTWAWPKASV